MKNLKDKFVRKIERIRDCVLSNFSKKSNDKTRKKNMRYRNDNFEKSLKTGTKAEKLFIEQVSNSPDDEIIADVRNDKEYRKKDIDFIVNDVWGDNQRYYEVKTMKQDKINVEVLAMYSDLSNKKSWSIGAGWIVKSKADYFAFVDVQERKIFSIKADLLRKYIYKNNNQKNFIETYYFEESDRKKKNMIQRIQLDDIKHLGELTDL